MPLLEVSDLQLGGIALTSRIRRTYKTSEAVIPPRTAGSQWLSRESLWTNFSYTHSPLRISGSAFPSAVMPSTSISAEPIIQST